MDQNRTFSYTTTRADIRALTRYVIFKQKPSRTIVRALVTTALLISGAFQFQDNWMRAVLRGLSPEPILIFWDSPLLVIGTLIVALTLMQSFFAQVPKIAGREFTIREFGIISNQREWQAVFSWNSFIKIARDGEAIYAFMSPLMAIILPKRLFDSDADMEACYDQIEAAWEDRVNAPHLPALPETAYAVRFVLGAKDYKRAYRWAAGQAPIWNRSLRIAIPLMVVVVEILLNWKVVYTTIGLILTAALYTIHFFLAYYAMGLRNRILAKQNAVAPGSLSERSVGLTQSGLLTRSEHTGAMYPWAGIEKIQADREMIYFLLPSDTPAIVPRAAFLDYADSEAFLEAARAFKAGNAPETTSHEAWPPPPAA